MTKEQREWLLEFPLGGANPNRVRLAALLSGKSLRSIARLAGLSKWKVERIASGFTRRTAAGDLEAICKVLGFSLDELFADRPFQNGSIPELPPDALVGLGEVRRTRRTPGGLP